MGTFKQREITFTMTSNDLLNRLRRAWNQPTEPPDIFDGPRNQPATSEIFAGADAGPDADPWDWFDHVADGDLAYLLGPRSWPAACVRCGGRLLHNSLCVTLTDDWTIVMPFGKHKGRAVRELDRDYLHWLLRSGMDLSADLRREIELALRAA